VVVYASRCLCRKKTAYELIWGLEFRRVLFRSLRGGGGATLGAGDQDGARRIREQSCSLVERTRVRGRQRRGPARGCRWNGGSAGDRERGGEGKGGGVVGRWAGISEKQSNGAMR